MSSDVYIGISKTNPDAYADDDAEIIRIGHLGLISYFGYNFLDALRYLHDAQPTISLELPDQLNRLAGALQKHIEEIKTYEPDYFVVRWGYVKPEDWEDTPEPGDFDELRQFIGQHWNYWWD